MKAGWEIKKLGEVCDIFTGQGAPQGESNYGTEGVPFIKAGNLEDLINGLPESMIQHVSDEVAKKHKLKLYESNSIVFAKSGMSCMKGHIYTLKGDCYVVSHLAILTPRKMVSSFLNYVLRFHRPNSLIKDSAYPSISLEDIKSFSIPIPPLPEQERIVSELDLISGVIEKKKQQLKELDSLAQSVFYEMFGNPVENEKGWETAKVIDVVKLQRGYDLPTNDRVQSGDIPVWGSNGIVGYHNMSKIDFGIITGRSGTLGTVYSYDKPFFPLNTTLFSIDTHGNDIVYLRFLLNAYDLKRFGTGTGVPTLNRNTFHSEKIINVPLYLQQEFASKIESIEKQKELIKHSLQETETLFNSRMDFYFN